MSPESDTPKCFYSLSTRIRLLYIAALLFFLDLGVVHISLKYRLSVMFSTAPVQICRQVFIAAMYWTVRVCSRLHVVLLV
ncbi:hypothetical protein BJX64DRAFT_263450 [Aspergillus heterothallicus]